MMTEKDYSDELMAHAENGNSEAMYELGRISYCRGEYNSAFEWWQKAHKSNNPRATAWLGLCYMNGRGTWCNHSIGMSLYESVANQGFKDVQFKVAREYFFGDHVKVDYHKAFHWLTLCVEPAEDESKEIEIFVIDTCTPEYCLAKCYEKGLGTDVDMQKAISWYTKATEKGDYQAENALKRINQ